ARIQGRRETSIHDEARLEAWFRDGRVETDSVEGGHPDVESVDACRQGHEGIDLETCRQEHEGIDLETCRQGHEGIDLETSRQDGDLEASAPTLTTSIPASKPRLPSGQRQRRDPVR
ncbi:MAG TPA: hypothetical protein VFS15_01720, partial [Kofleriaceae bacterium]|nr:hypothetical protein [Kofleriaceae bacterium]